MNTIWTLAALKETARSRKTQRQEESTQQSAHPSMTPSSSPLDRLGFPTPTEVVGLKTVAHLFGSSKRRCGIYLLVLANERFYIGQAVDVVRRFAQHAKTHERIEKFSFIPTAKSKLDAQEKALIFAAENAGLTLVNVVHVSNTYGESDLDDLVSPDELTAWLKAPFQKNGADFATQPIALPMAHVARFEANYARFKDNPFFKTATVLLYRYLDSAVPFPRRTEYTFWAVSCLPSTNRYTFPRLLCLSASVMELFCLGYYKDPELAEELWGFLNVASDVLFDAYGSEAKFQQAYPQIVVRRISYRDAGQHQVNLLALSQHDMFDLLNDEAVTKAAAELCVRLIRKRATIYSKFHCPQLVDASLSLRAMEDEEFEKVVDAVFFLEDEAAKGRDNRNAKILAREL
jgi:hypothetical protein